MISRPDAAAARAEKGGNLVALCRLTVGSGQPG
jgi:hypothetical protein